MTMREFIYDRLGQFVLQTVFVTASAAFLLATGTAGGIVALWLVIGLVVFGCAQTADFVRRRSHLRELENMMESLEKKYLFAECVPKPRDAYERRVLELSRRAGRAMIGAVSEAQAAQREYREYVESWVHEIKAPITAAQLIGQNADPAMRRKLSRELAQIESHVERALFYARAENPEKDFVIRQFCLADIAAQAIDRHKTLLIQNGVRVETEDLGRTVYTDDKWVIFMIGQLLQNAARYRGENPVVTFSSRQLGNQVQLAVCDNGIGIPAHELPRVCERGFTGSNGRLRGGSTGMGLYLCRRLAESLEIHLQVRSQEGSGTKVILTFPAKGNLTKM